MEVPFFLSVKLPHLFSAYVFIDKRRVIAYKSLADLGKDYLSVAALYKAHIRVNKSKPKTKIVVLDFIEPLFTLFGILV